MIWFEADGKNVKTHIETGTGTARPVWVFSFGEVEEECAVVMAAHLQKRLEDIMESVREEAYAKGWADAKAKRKRKTRFSVALPMKKIWL